MKFTWCILAAVAAVASFSSSKRIDYTGNVILKITPRNEAELGWLSSLRYDVDLDIWRGPSLNKPMVMRIGKKVTEEKITKYLDGMQMKYSFLTGNLQSEIDKFDEQLRLRSEQHKQSSSSYDFENYHTFEEIVTLLQGLAANYSYVTYTEIGTTFEGRKIPSVTLSTGADKPLIFFDCTIHAREWLATTTCTHIINELATKYGVDSEVTQLLDRYDWQFSPVTNPDGYVYTWETDRLWRKNRVPTYNQSCPGIDLNRNFDDHFGGPDSSEDACSNEYHGVGPFSEKETQAIRDILLSNQARVQAVFSIHTYSQYWMMPYACTTDLPPEPQFTELDRVMQTGVKALQDTYGTVYENGTVANILYFACGSSTDWAFNVLGAPYAYTIELRSTNSFVLPPEEIMPTAVETWNGIRAATLAMKSRVL